MGWRDPIRGGGEDGGQTVAAAVVGDGREERQRTSAFSPQHFLWEIVLGDRARFLLAQTAAG